MRRRFLFDTGVRPESGSPLMEGQLWVQDSGGLVKVIPYYCEDVPENADPMFLCDDPDLYSDAPNIIVREVFDSVIMSKYAYFRLPL